MDGGAKEKNDDGRSVPGSAAPFAESRHKYWTVIGWKVRMWPLIRQRAGYFEPMIALRKPSVNTLSAELQLILPTLKVRKRRREQHCKRRYGPLKNVDIGIMLTRFNN